MSRRRSYSFGVAGDFVDFCEEQDAAEERAKATRDAGDFHPFYVAHPQDYTPVPMTSVRWAVYYQHPNGARIDLGNVAPHWASLPYFWRFKTACRVAYALRDAMTRNVA